jgi:hypothetical protein
MECATESGMVLCVFTEMPLMLIDKGLRVVAAVVTSVAKNAGVAKWQTHQI